MRNSMQKNIILLYEGMGRGPNLILRGALAILRYATVCTVQGKTPILALAVSVPSSPTLQPIH